MSKISVSRYNILHGSFLVMNLFGLVWYCMEIFNLHYLIKYFSVQAFWLAIFYSITSFVKSTRNSKITQILYELSFTTNMIACLGYWIIVRPHVLKLIPSIFYIKISIFYFMQRFDTYHANFNADIDSLLGAFAILSFEESQVSSISFDFCDNCQRILHFLGRTCLSFYDI